jgi:MFS family permease
MSQPQPPASYADSTSPAAGLATAASLTAHPDATESTAPVKKGYIAVLVLAYFALYVAWIAPMAFSLAIRVEQIDPAGKNAALPLVLGVSSLAALVTGPIVGVLSDRTRSRFGKRRTWMLIGMVIGLVGSILVGLSPSIPLLTLAWAVAYIGYTSTGGMFVTHLGDRLPAAQQGRVAGFTGAVSQVAPVMGVAVAGAFAAVPLAMFAIPAALAFVVGLVFIFVMKDAPAAATAQPIDMKQLLQGFWFNPRRHPNFGWVWISRAFIFLALSFMQVYSVYLLADRLQLDSATIAGIVSTSGLLGIVFAIASSIVSGTLSDKLGRRKPFIVGAGLLLAVGLVVTGTVSSIPQYYIGSIIGIIGVGAFGAIDQAIGLDNLPKEEGQNGRFIGVFGLANQLAQAAGPFLAGAVIALAAGNYSWVYFVAAAFAIIGGLLILPVKSNRASAANGATR